MFAAIQVRKKPVITAQAVSTINIVQRYGSFLAFLTNMLGLFFADDVRVLSSNTISQIADGGCPCPEGTERCGAGKT